MSKEYIEQYVEAKALGRTPRKTRPRFDVVYEPMQSSAFTLDTDIVYRLGVRVETRFKGQPEALPHLRKRAVSAVVHELYGDIHKELHELRIRLWEEDYRADDDPIIKQVEKLLEMTRP